MGLNYKYLLYFYKDQVWNVLQALGAISDNEGITPTTIHFLDHDLLLSLTSSWGEKDEHPHDKPVFHFSLSLFFKPDSAILEYLRDRDGESLDHSPPHDRDTGEVAIGFIYLTVYVDLSSLDSFKEPANLVLFEFYATGTHMSLLFSASQSIRRVFNCLLEKYGGVIGILDRENDYGELFWFKGKPIQASLSSNFMLPHEIEAELKRGW